MACRYIIHTINIIKYIPSLYIFLRNLLELSRILNFSKKKNFHFCPLRYCITALIFLFSKSKEITYAMHICRTKYFGSASLNDS